jgi:hypothetical protein
MTGSKNSTGSSFGASSVKTKNIFNFGLFSFDSDKYVYEWEGIPRFFLFKDYMKPKRSILEN